MEKMVSVIVVVGVLLSDEEDGLPGLNAGAAEIRGVAENLLRDDLAEYVSRAGIERGQ